MWKPCIIVLYLCEFVFAYSLLYYLYCIVLLFFCVKFVLTISINFCTVSTEIKVLIYLKVLIYQLFIELGNVTTGQQYSAVE